MCTQQQPKTHQQQLVAGPIHQAPDATIVLPVCAARLYNTQASLHFWSERPELQISGMPRPSHLGSPQNARVVAKKVSRH